MLVCRRAALSTLLVSATDVLMLGSVLTVLCPPPGGGASPLLPVASAEEAMSASSTAASLSALTVPTPATWLPPVIDVNSPKLQWKDVITCCRSAPVPAVLESTTSCAKVPSPSSSDTADASASDESDPESCRATATSGKSSGEEMVLETHTLGRIPQFTTEQTLQVLDAARSGWDSGKGAWTTMSLEGRVAAIQAFLSELQKVREPMVQTLMMEIGKNRNDSEAEFDRTMDFCRQVIRVVQTNPEYVGHWQTIGSTSAFVKRAAIGVYLSLAPYNYPLNECYAAIIPCLLMGNVVILKIPTIGGLVHLWTMEAFRKALPPGTINFVAGSGRSTMPPLMKTGHVDGLAFIGGSKAADELIQIHPHPHRLHVFLQLEANNLAVYLPSVFEDLALLSSSLDQAVVGSLSFNGQRCTALKLHYVPQQHAERFVNELVQRVDALHVGLADDVFDDGKQSQVTPLPSRGRIEYMQELIKDAVAKGAKIMNRNGGNVLGGPGSTLMVPAVLYPVTKNMRVYGEEQFGPVVPVAVYQDLSDVLDYAQGDENVYGQQISIFGSDPDAVAPMIDRFASVFGRINLNAQCGRSPDTVPFSGRRSSAMGTMSVTEALREFSIPTVVAYSNGNPSSRTLVEGLPARSKFLQSAGLAQQ
jgi:glyceraldehyde-3-phosphate dehydrogenase (NADP+)